MKRFLSVLCIFLSLSVIFAFETQAESTNHNNNMPYYSYVYNDDDKAIQIPSPYSAYSVLHGEDVGVGNFSSLSDVFYDQDTGNIYLTDTGTNRIVILNSEFKLIKEIKGFNNGKKAETFNAPESVCVRHNKIYIADTGNSRIVILNANTYKLEKVLNKPYVKLLEENYTYLPSRLAVDLAGRIYVIATDINDGIFLIDQNGEFIRFAGAPDVTADLWTKFLKIFMTKAQKANLDKTVPTEYSSFLMDENGFLYLTSSDSTVHPITKLNSQGSDILKYDGEDYPDGDSSHMLKRTEKIIST